MGMFYALLLQLQKVWGTHICFVLEVKSLRFRVLLLLGKNLVFSSFVFS